MTAVGRPAVQPAPRAFGDPLGQAVFRHQPEDFHVVEHTGIVPEGDGEHLWLWTRKRDNNTAWIAGELARHYGRPRVDVGYAGRKDRHAVCEQWFSVRLPGRETPPPPELPGVEWLTLVRHRRKLATGALRGNGFRLRLRAVRADRDAVDARLHDLATRGVPNYFGAQRFGVDGRNLERAWSSFAGERPASGRAAGGREQREMAMSAARSWAFNRVLAERVRDASWEKLLPGEVAMLDGTHSVFAVDVPDDALHARARQGDLHPTGPLPGIQDKISVSGACLDLENAALAPLAPMLAGLQRAGLRAQRRSLRLRVQSLQWSWEDGDLILAFDLPAGAYATAVLHELLDCRDALAMDAQIWC